ncbi:MAG: D-alanyl-D-alanine carboxypeptidase [Selenomonadaceae bacterium]|nr:D-alanyl-D-alanine carboxypeptidase [Selenomonadaceae bacterium]
MRRLFAAACLLLALCFVPVAVLSAEEPENARETELRAEYEAALSAEAAPSDTPNAAEEPPVYIPPNDALPQVTARSAVVMDALTGEILYQRCMDDRRYPASTTKIMTLITALESDRGGFDDAVTISAAAANMEGSTMWLEYGERYRLEELLYGMMLVSGNDAAVAVAEHVAGSVPAFAKRMTEKAQEIGAKNTHFVNSCGLHDPRHYTTAYDLARITAHGFKNPTFRKIISTKERNVPLMKPPFSRNLENENMLLWIYKGANGVKTGYTDDAGRCVVTAAERDGVQLIAVVLDGAYMWNDSIAMLDYGFRHIEAREFVKKGEKIASIAVEGGEQGSVGLTAEKALRLPVPNGDASAYQRKIKTPRAVEAPVRRGEKLGEAVYYYRGEKIASVSLLAEGQVERKNSFLAGLSRVWHKITALFS